MQARRRWCSKPPDFFVTAGVCVVQNYSGAGHASAIGELAVMTLDVNTDHRGRSRYDHADAKAAEHSRHPRRDPRLPTGTTLEQGIMA
jgi:hypothetical protein